MAETSTPRAFGSYLVERELGRGGMGVVYAARDEVVGKRVAVKVLLDDVSRDGELVERFFNEARAAGAIEHPGIVAVHHVGKDDRAVYIVMELLQGESLASRLKTRGAMQLATAIGLARQCANALEAAHQAGIVHRDLKPDNVFLVPDVEVAGGERVKLLDFGVAKLLGDGSSSVARTVTGAILGTPHYMSPEQCEGAREVDARSDLYSLGCMLFQMVSGRLPFQSAGIGGLIGMHLHVSPPTLRSVRPDAPVELEALVAKLLAKHPDERIQTAAEVAAALETLPTRSSQPVLAPPPPPPVVDVATETVATMVAPPPALSSPPPPPVRRRRWLWPALAAAAIAVAAIVVLASRRDDDRAPITPEPTASAPLTPPVTPAVRVEPTPAPVVPAPSTAPIDAPATRSPIDTELELGEGKLARRDFDGALDHAKFALRAAPDSARAKTLAIAAKHGKVERLIARMRASRDARRYTEVKRDLELVLQQATDPAQRAAANKIWTAVKLELTATFADQVAALRKQGACDELVALAKQTGLDVKDELAVCRKVKQNQVSHAGQVRSALLRLEHTSNSIALSGCLDLVSLDPTQIPWDRCIRVQCEVSPFGVHTLLLSAPVGQHQRLRALCPAATKK